MRRITPTIIMTIMSAISTHATYWDIAPLNYGECEVDGIKYGLLSEDDGKTKFVSIMGFATDEANIPRSINFANQVVINDQTYPVTRVARKAFDGCEDPHEFILPDRIERICTYAFSNCKELKIQLRSNHLILCDSAFYKSNIVNPEAIYDVSVVWNRVLSGSKAEALTIGSGLEFLSTESFIDSDISVIKFSDCRNTAYIARQAFTGSNVREVTLGANMLLPGEMFYDCKKLERIIIPEAEYHTYSINCTSGLDESEPPNFDFHTNCIIAECPALKEIVLRSETPQKLCELDGLGHLFEAELGFFEIIDDYDYCTLKVPAGSEEAYRAHHIWGSFTHIEGFQPGEYTGTDYAIAFEEKNPQSHTIKAMANENGLEIELQEPCTVEIYNLTGSLMLRTQHDGGLLHAALPKGLYLVRCI